MNLHARTAPYPFEVKKLKTQAKLRCSINGRFSRVNPCNDPKFRFLGTVLVMESEFEVSFDLGHTPDELGYQKNEVLLKTRFSADISRFRRDTLLLTSDSESTQISRHIGLFWVQLRIFTEF